MKPLKLHIPLSDEEAARIAKATTREVEWQRADVSGRLDILRAELDELRHDLGEVLNRILRGIENKKD